MRKWIGKFLWILFFVVVFFYFFSIKIGESNGYKKFRFEDNQNGYGFVVRMKPEGWELWKIEKKVETQRLFPLHSSKAEKSEKVAGQPKRVQKSAPFTEAA